MDDVMVRWQFHATVTRSSPLIRFLPPCVVTAGLLAMTLLAGDSRGAEPRIVTSPHGTIQLRFAVDQGVPRYEIRRGHLPVVGWSRLGVAFADDGSFVDRLAEISQAERRVDQTWTQPWGEKKTIRDHYCELRVSLRRLDPPYRRMDIIFRVFDDGVGFRYEWPAQEELTQFQITDELTEFDLAGDHTVWWIPAYQHDRYEHLYQRTPLSEVAIVHTPCTMKTDDGLYLSFHEAALTDYASMTLERTSDTKLKANLVPWSDGIKVRATAPHRSPWRTIQISPDAAGLITSYLILNLNEPNALGDVSWITPGKYAGVWWEMHLSSKTWSSGPQHGATTSNAKKHIDFAAANGMIGVLVEGWNRGWDGDWMQNGDKFQFTEPYPDFDIREVTRYAAAQGVGLIGHHETSGAIANYEGKMTDAFDYLQSLGVCAVKTGYVNFGQNIERLDENQQPQMEWHHGQFMVRHYRKVIEEAAKRQIVLNVHEPIKDTGERRMFPNMMTREGARGQEYEAWGGDGGNPPDHTVILPFTRMLAGPMDYCPGVFDVLFEEARPDNRVNTTLTKQLALFVVLFSPLQMVPDLPENYAAHPDAFQFIKDVPTDWEDTRVLHAEIGDYVTIVRQERGGGDWYLGSITDEVGRVLLRRARLPDARALLHRRDSMKTVPVPIGGRAPWRIAFGGKPCHVRRASSFTWRPAVELPFAFVPQRQQIRGVASYPDAPHGERGGSLSWPVSLKLPTASVGDHPPAKHRAGRRFCVLPAPRPAGHGDGIDLRLAVLETIRAPRQRPPRIALPRFHDRRDDVAGGGPRRAHVPGSLGDHGVFGAVPGGGGR